MGNNSNEDLDKYQQILSRLGAIQHDVDSLKQTTAFALRAEADKHLESVQVIFQKSERRVQVYLAVNGGRTVSGIASHLGMKGPNVSTELKILREEGLIELIDSGGGDIYAKTPVDHTLRISRYLTKKYNFTSDGLRAPDKGRK